jgi:hypothetical protein
MIAALYYFSCHPPRYYGTSNTKKFSATVLQDTAATKLFYILISPIVFPILIFLNFINNYTGGNFFFFDKYLRDAFIQTNYPAFLKGRNSA